MIALEGYTVRFGALAALDAADLRIAPGERVGLVGESGSGKSMLGLSLMGMVPEAGKVEGRVLVAGRDMSDARDRDWRALRARQVAMIFQEPMAALNPLRRVGDTVMEPLRVHLGLSRAEARARALELFREVRLTNPEARLRMFPHELSGGQRQRVLIALALTCAPALLIADEPTSALDAHVGLEITSLLRRLSEERQMALLLISHDLAVVARTTERVLVMTKGQIVERGPTAEVLSRPAHPYTQRLLAARPDPRETGKMLRSEVTPLVAAEGLTRRYPLPRKSLFERGGALTALEDVSFTLRRGETLGVVGESGSGKSTLARLVMGFERPDAGTVHFDGHALSAMDEADLRPLRPRFQMVFQDPYGSLDPRRPVGWSIAEPIRALGEESAGRVAEVLTQVGLTPADKDKYPHEFSGGQRQRIAIARAIITRPELLVADEAVSALDISVQAQIINLLMCLQKDLGLAILFISHDLPVVAHISDHMLVLRQGRVVERGPAAELFAAPREAYTKTLLTAAEIRP